MTTQSQNTTQSDSRIKDGLDSARETASHTTEQVSETIDANPLAMLAGGFAVGAVAGALLPRSDREKDLLRPVGAKLGATAVAALAAAREAGRSELEQRGLTTGSARDQAKSLFDNVAKAASGAATAAANSAKQEATGTIAQPDSTGATAQPDSTGGTGDAVPPADPHRQVIAGDRETSFNSSL